MVLALALALQVVVAVDGGKLEGSIDSATGVHVFRGIPYAAPPVGRLRWQPPKPAAPWQGVRHADHVGKNCMQRHIYDDIDASIAGMSEDCLYLNVWSEMSPQLRPVMVWIHGGAFQAGFGGEDRHGAGRLARKGVVVVSMNYRLGPFGFLGGNYGLLDQIAALTWIHQNIRAFEGDPDNVTIFGESAGALSVAALLTQQRIGGLFKRAILESGTGIGYHPLSANEAALNAVLFEKMLHADDSRQLRTLSADSLLFDNAPLMMPFIDGNVIPRPIDSALLSGHFNNVPVIVGNNADEDSANFREPARTFARLITRHGGRAYRYVFSRRGDDQGAYHSAEITFVFDHPRASGHTDYDSTLAETMSDYWVAFATTGDPNGPPRAGQRPLWPVYDPAKDTYLELGPVIIARP